MAIRAAEKNAQMRLAHLGRSRQRTTGRSRVNRTEGAMKHGDSAYCGSDQSYRLLPQRAGEPAPRAYCKFCQNEFSKFVPGFPLGMIVKRPAKWLKSMRISGVRGLPIDGRVVGGTDGGWPVIEWSDGSVYVAKPEHLLAKNAPDRTNL